MIDINDLIQGEKFIQIADFAFCYSNDDFNVFENTFTVDNVNKCEKDIILVYTHTHWVENLFKFINENNITKKIILITHNSDHEVNEELFRKKPKNVIKWYSQNINFNQNDLISIPIGLENNRWYPEKIPIMINKSNEKKNIKNLLYINHSVRTYPLEREKPYRIFKDKSWCTLVEGKNGQNFDNYIDNIYNHKYVLAPRGNGIDSHRLFESLHAKSIPIVIKNINNSQYSDLPIIYVDDWEEVTEDFLNKKYIEINENIQNNIYNFEKLKFSYWKDLIYKAANRI